MALRDELIAAGHLTVEPSPIIETVTVSGYYHAENGYFYYVAVDGGNRSIDWLGKSAAYRQAERELEAQGILDLPEDDAAFEAGIRRLLHLA